MMALDELKRDMKRDSKLFEANHYDEEDVVYSYSYDTYHGNNELIQSMKEMQKLTRKIIRDMISYGEKFNKDFSILIDNNHDNHDIMEMLLMEFENEGFNINEDELKVILNLIMQFSDSVLFTYNDEE